MEYQFAYHCDYLGVDMYAYKGYHMPLEYVEKCISDERYYRTKYEAGYAKKLIKMDGIWHREDLSETRRKYTATDNAEYTLEGEVFVGLDGSEYLIEDK